MTDVLEGAQLTEELRGREPLTGSIRLRERKSDSRAVLDEFQIKGVLHAGSSCICYKAVRIFEESGIAETGTLKEFYPADSVYDAAAAFHLKRQSPAAGVNARHLYSARSTLANFISARNEFRKCYEKISALKLDKKKYDYFFEPVRFYRGIAADDCADNYTLYIWHPGDSGLQSFADYLDEAFLRIKKEAEAPSCDLNLMLACELHTILQAVRMLATGINNLHMEDFLHLDIKPANFGIRMSEKGKVDSVSLFDINTIYPRAYSGRRTAGTPFFRAPEMTGDTYNNAKNIAVGCRSDIYSLGATLYNSIIMGIGGRGLYEPKKFKDIDADLSRSLLMELSDYNSRAELQSLLLEILKRSLARKATDYASIGEAYRSMGAFLRDISEAEELAAREITNAKKAGTGNKAVVSIVSNEEYYAAETDGGAAGSMQRLLYDTPLYDYTDNNGDVNILVLGAGVFGQKFTDTAFQLAQIKNCRPDITVVSNEKGRDEARYLNARPEFRKYFSVNGEVPLWCDYGVPGSISFVESEMAGGASALSGGNARLLSSSLGEKQKFSYVFISLSDEQLNRELALELAGSELIGRGEKGNAVISFVTYKAEGGARGAIFAEKQAELAEKGITVKPVRVTDTLLNHRDYTALCEMAFNCHLLWNGSVNADMKKLYEEFRSPYTFRGSLANALSLKYKLHSIGLDISEAVSEKNKRQRSEKLLELTKRFRELVGSGRPYDEKTPGQQQCISELMYYEHRRWLVNMITDLSYGLLPESDYHILTASNRDSSARRHACLVPSAQTQALKADFWSDNLSVWDAPDIEQNADFMALDPLDRASVMLHRHFVSVVMKTDFEAAENDASVIRKQLAGSPEALSVFNSYMISLRNMVSLLRKSVQGEQLERTLAENQFRLAQRGCEAVKRLADCGNQEIARRLSNIENAYAPVKRAIAYTRYKDNDEKLIEGIPFMLNFSSDTRLIIPFVNGKSNNKWFENAAAAIAVNPSVITYLIRTDGSEEELSVLKDVIRYICGVMDNHNLQTQLGLILFAGAQSSAVLQKTAGELKGVSSRIQSTDILICDDEDAVIQALGGIVGAAASGSGYAAAELNSSELGRLLASQPQLPVPAYRFDCVCGRFVSASSEQGYIWLEDIPFDAQLSIEDMFLSQGKLGVYHEAELHKDYKEIWRSCYSDGSGDTCRARAWNALCRAVREKTDAQNVILRLQSCRNRVDSGVQLVPKAFFVPEFCGEAAEKIFGFFASPQINMLSGLQIISHNSSMLKISFCASSEVCNALYSLLSDPYMLTQAECIRLSYTEETASVYFDSLIVNDFSISDEVLCHTDDEELVKYASDAFGFLADKGYIAVFEDDEGKSTVDFCFASAEIKELLTDECRLPELYVYYQLSASGCFDEIKNGLSVQNKTADFVQTPSARFDIVAVKGFRSCIIEVKSAQCLKEEFYQELKCNGDMYGINKELVLVNAMGDAQQCAEAEAYGIRTVCGLNEIENIVNTLTELMKNISVCGREASDMSNNEFRKTDDISEYLQQGLSDGTLVPGRYQKKGEFRARQGVVGEKIETIMADGLKETVNTVKTDENGNPGWVVTGIGGEEYIVEDSVFREKYQPAEGREGIYIPRSAPIVAAELSESICFVAPWGEEMKISAGGYLVFTNPSDIYGIQRAEFLATYEKTE